MGDSCFHLLFQRNSFVSWHLICSRARPLNESLCTPRACYIWGEVLYQGASVHALFPLKVLVEHIYEKAEASPLAEIFVQYNWDLGMMGQPAFAFAFARTGMSASRGIETLWDCEIQDGDLQNSNLWETKNETSKPVTNVSEILRSGKNFPRPTFFEEPFYTPTSGPVCLLI